MKFGQILFCCMTNILETISMSFYDFIKMTVSSEICSFLTVPHSPFFFKLKHCNLDIIDYWVIRVGCYIEKDLELSHSLSNSSKAS